MTDRLYAIGTLPRSVQALVMIISALPMRIIERIVRIAHDCRGLLARERYRRERCIRRQSRRFYPQSRWSARPCAEHR